MGNKKFNKGKDNHPFPKTRKEGGTPVKEGGSSPASIKQTSLMDKAAHISTFKIAGKPVRGMDQNGAMDLLVSLDNKINVTKVTLTPGICENASSPFNKCIIELFNQVRGKYTSSVPFQAADLGMYILAFGQIYAFVGAIKRQLESLKIFSSDSLLMPELYHGALVNASGVSRSIWGANYQYDVKHAPMDEFELEVALNKLRGFYMPKMAFIDFCKSLYRNAYFEDKTGVRGDIEAFTFGDLLTWYPDIPVKGQESKADPITAAGLKYMGMLGLGDGTYHTEGLIKALNTMISQLVQSDDIRTISGWIKQYMPDAVQIAEDINLDAAEPLDGDVVVNLIAGARNVNTTRAVDIINQDPNTESVYYQNYFTQNNVLPQRGVMNWVINYDHEVTDSEIAEASRLCFTFYENDADAMLLDTSVCYAEYTSSYFIETTGEFNIDVQSYFRVLNGNAVPQVEVVSILRAHEQDHRPTFLFYNPAATGVRAKCTFEYNTAYAVPVDATSLRNMHYADIVAMFEVGGISNL